MAENDQKKQAAALLISDRLSDDELADVIHYLTDILHQRLRDKPSEGSGLKRQIDAARVEVRSWPSSRQRQIKEFLGT